MNKVNEYRHQCLAATGFCVFNSAIASRIRPDLWSNGLQCAAEFSEAKKRGYEVPKGASEYLLRLQSLDFDLQLFARNPQGLFERIEWICGLPVLALHPMAQLAGVPTVSTLKQAPRKDVGGDLFTIQTKEPGRLCSDCDHIAGINTCRDKDKSGIAFPKVNTLRRCRAFKPKFESYDSRNGDELWPELANLSFKETNHGA